MGTALNYTLNSLKRWSSVNNVLPPVENINEIHVYDFDNTLFRSPLPNRAIWDEKSRGRLYSADVFMNGGWFHDLSILAATGEGVDIEEPRAWKGWWNEKIVELVQLSAQQDDVLTVLLTGRAEGTFPELIGRICKSKGLTFDMMCYKPSVGPNNEKFSSTMNFKQVFLDHLLRTYVTASSFRIYEDRENHVTGFREWIEQSNLSFNSEGTRQSIKGDVIPVIEVDSHLDPITEAATIQAMINAHNRAILAGTAPPKFVPFQLNKLVLYTAYSVVHPAETDKLLSFLPPAARMATKRGPAKLLANSILITGYPAPPHVLKKVGGKNARVVFQVTDIGVLEDKLWALRVAPVDKSVTVFHIDGPHKPPAIVLAIRGGARPADVKHITKWEKIPLEKTVSFETEVRDIFRLTIEEEPNPTPINNENFPPIASSRKAPPPTHSNTNRDHAAIHSYANAAAAQPPPQRPSSFNRRGHGPQHRPGGDGGGRRDFHGYRGDRGGGGGGRGRGGPGRGGFVPRGGGGGGAGRGGYRDYDAQDRGREREREKDGMYDAY
jgi:HAD domain family 1 in Swiss Army Knife RNA repair proteins